MAMFLYHGVRVLTASEVAQARLADNYSSVVDIRSRAEIEATGSMPEAVEVPLIDAQMVLTKERVVQRPNEEFLRQIKQLFPDAGHTLILMCSDGGKRSAEATRMLTDAGYTDVVLLDGGYLAWYATTRKDPGVPVRDRTPWISWRQALKEEGKAKAMAAKANPVDDVIENDWARAREELKRKEQELASRRQRVEEVYWEFSSDNPGRKEIVAFLSWFQALRFLDSYMLEPTLSAFARMQIHQMARARGLLSKSYGPKHSRCLEVSRKGAKPRGKKTKVEPVMTLDRCPEDAKLAITALLEGDRPVYMPMPEAKSWNAMRSLSGTMGFQLDPIAEAGVVVLSKRTAPLRDDGREPQYCSDSLTMADAPLAALQEAVAQAAASLQRLSATAARRRAAHRHAIPSLTAAYAVDEAKRRELEPQRRSLPIRRHREEILAALAQHRVVILDGPTGSGKSTQVPQYILDSGLLTPQNPVVIVTQPRRLAAVSLAQRVAQERGQAVGEEVGYQVRFAGAMGRDTRLVFMTSGILLRRLQDDPGLKGVGCIIVDEVHERTLDVDFILLLMKQALLAGQTRARLVVMSATLQANVFAEYFAPVLAQDRQRAAAGAGTTLSVPNTVHFEGRTYPVRDFYLEDALAWTGYRLDGKGNCVPGGPAAVDCAPTLQRWLSRAAREAVEGASRQSDTGEEELAWPVQPPVLEPVFFPGGGGGTPRGTEQDVPEDLEETEEWGEEMEAAGEVGTVPGVADDSDESAMESDDGSESQSDFGEEDDDEEEERVYAALAAGKTVNTLEVQTGLVTALIWALHRTGVAGAVLVFLPGLAEIRAVRAALLGGPRAAELLVITLHSMLPLAEQRALFNPPPPGQRKVVLSTNIAESSITVNDVIFVIDSGLAKTQQYNPETNLSSLECIQLSKMNTIQRRGRAGRVQPGVAIHLFPREGFQRLPDSMPSELNRVPLEEVCLQLKSLGFWDVQQFLRLALDPPKPQSVDNALDALQQLGALARDAERSLTPLGRLLAAMPIHPTLSRLLVTSALFGVLEPVATIVAILSNKSPYMRVVGAGAEKALRVKRWDMAAKGAPDSDFILLLRLFEKWQRSYNRLGFCREYGLSSATMQEVLDTRQQHLVLFQTEMQFGESAFFNRNAGNHRLISSVVAMCMYPNVAHRKRKAWWSPGLQAYTRLSPDSLAREQESLGGFPYLAFVERRALGKRVLVDNTSFVGLLPILLACGQFHVVPAVSEEDGWPLVFCDGWLFVRTNQPELGDVLAQAHATLQGILQGFADGRKVDEQWAPLLDKVADFISPRPAASSLTAEERAWQQWEQHQAARSRGFGAAGPARPRRRSA
eukprot:EG_transcript_505